MTTPATTSPREPIKVVADILQAELDLEAGHVMLAYEQWELPEDKGLYVDVAYLGPSRLICVSNDFDDETNEEVQQVTMFQLVAIDLLSFDGSARARKEEVAMALASFYSQRQQEINQLQIARHVSPFVDASSLEATKRLNRFTTTVAVTSLHTRRRPPDYFDKFNQRPPFLAGVNAPEVITNA